MDEGHRSFGAAPRRRVAQLETVKLEPDQGLGEVVDLDYETVGQAGSMLMVTASGTAVKLG